MNLLFLLIILLVAVLIFLISLIKLKNKKNINYVISITIAALLFFVILYFPKITMALNLELSALRGIMVSVLLILFGVVFFKIVDIVMSENKIKDDLKISGIMLSIILIIYNFIEGMNLYLSISELSKATVLMLIKIILENVILIYAVNSLLSKSAVKIPNLNICFSISLITGAIIGGFQNKIAYIILFQIILGMMIYVVIFKLLKLVSKINFKGLFFGGIVIIISYIITLL